MNNRISMFPGTFDPPTLGHFDIIKRSSEMYEKVYVVVAQNAAKKPFFSQEERKEMLTDMVKDLPNVEVVIWNGLNVDFAKKNNVGVMVRGVRSVDDFSYEYEISQVNKSLCPELEVVFIPANINFVLFRSSSVKEIASFGADVSNLVPESVAKALAKKQKC